MTILVLDAFNLLHRSRSGFTQGEYAIVYNFLRGLRPLVERFEPTRVYMALEGHPKQRFAKLPEYKANRRVAPGTAKSEALVDFNRQKDLVLGLIERHFPINVVWHPDYEADDTISNIVRRSSTTAEFVIVSSDTDFMQLICENVKVYDPVRKKFLEWNPDDDYVVFKALKGDPADNIPGISGFGEKKAMQIAKDGKSNPVKLVNDMCALAQVVGNEVTMDITRNLELVRLATWTDEELKSMTCSLPTRDWEAVKAQFDEWRFASMTKPQTWEKFVNTFDRLFGDP